MTGRRDHIRSDAVTENTKCGTNADSMLVQRRRRRAKIEPALIQYFVTFAHCWFNAGPAS